MFDRSLAMSFQALNYPSHILGCVDMRRNSILSQTDESGNLPESNKDSGLSTASTSSVSADSLLNQANTVGIVGGVSVNSTLKFLSKLVQWSSKDGQNSLSFVLCSDPVLNKEFILHENNSLSYLRSKTEYNQLDPLPVVGNLWSKRNFLEKSGARCIVMPGNISNTWYDEVSKGCSAPFLRMGECVAMELKEVKLKPLEAGSPLRIGVLATNATLSAGFYQDKLQSEGFEVVLPDKATMEHTVIPAIEALNRNDMEGARSLLRIASRFFW